MDRRREQINDINLEINKINSVMNADKIIIGGDFNMRDCEDNNKLIEEKYTDIKIDDSYTYPNNNCTKKLDIVSLINFRFDRFYTRGIPNYKFRIMTDILDSDHFPLELVINC
jgi:endonuclease/exonuclease/phosphatase family metal-dependent hydrolase